MSYRIQYDIHKHPWEKRMKQNKAVFTTIALCVIFLLAGFVCMNYFSLLLPGEPEVTAAALENMTGSLLEGQSLGSAVVAFCQEVLDHAEYSQ